MHFKSLSSSASPSSPSSLQSFGMHYFVCLFLLVVTLEKEKSGVLRVNRPSVPHFKRKSGLTVGCRRIEIQKE
jgi:hypothetical protein